MRKRESESESERQRERMREKERERARRWPVPSLRATKNTRTNGLAHTIIVVGVVFSSPLSIDIFAKGVCGVLVYNYVEYRPRYMKPRPSIQFDCLALGRTFGLRSSSFSAKNA